MSKIKYLDPFKNFKFRPCSNELWLRLTDEHDTDTATHCTAVAGAGTAGRVAAKLSPGVKAGRKPNTTLERCKKCSHLCPKSNSDLISIIHLWAMHGIDSHEVDALQNITILYPALPSFARWHDRRLNMCDLYVRKNVSTALMTIKGTQKKEIKKTKCV